MSRTGKRHVDVPDSTADAVVGAQQGPDPGPRRPIIRSFPSLLYGSRSRASGAPNRARTPKRVQDIIRSHSTTRPSGGFDRFQLRSQLLRAVADAGFLEPRPIQAEGIPPALLGRDVLGLAQTGTGKTAAFVLPILERLLASKRSGTRALVVAPTRELASQVGAEFERLARFTQLTSTVVFGGVPVARQVRALRTHPDVVVACPGRLLDLLGQRALNLDHVEVLVLDEADHMFDMGFLPDVRRILKALPARRQNLMFSATMPPEIRKLANTVLDNPVVIELAHSKPAETIEHALYPLAEGDKIGALERLLGGPDFRSGIVFLRTKRRAKKLAERLAQTGHAAVALQGNMSQGQRERALQGFRDQRFDVLVATDIAARGLDIAGVSHVVNFDVPNTPDAYTHRIGRTGRSEQAGTAFTFVTHEDAAMVRAIEKRLGAAIERRKLADLGAIDRASLTGRKSGRTGGSAPAAGARRSGRPQRSSPQRGATGERRAQGRPSTAPAKRAPAAAEQAPHKQARPAAFGLGVNEPRGREASAPAAARSGGRRRRRPARSGS